LNDNDSGGGYQGNAGGNAEMPWADDQMPCVYCGRLIPRHADRCPECKTSYSLAVRRASREVVGPWFYLEARNLSNRGVDFTTILKLIEKGRLKRNSVVRGPTTQQDWMYAAEVPLLSKHLGVCPHCFGPAGAEQEFCDHCHRSLDERPARLRPGVSEPGAEAYFPQREAMEAQLANALKTHDMAKAASEAVVADEETSALDDILGRQEAAPPHRPAAKRPATERKVKPHVVALLTVVTVIPLALIMLAVPIEWVFGNPDNVGSMAHRVRTNRTAFWSAFGGGSSDTKPMDLRDRPEVRQKLDAAAAAAGAGQYQEAIAVYEDLVRAHPGTRLATELQSEAEALRNRIRLKDEQARVLDKVAQIQAACDAGQFRRAHSLMDGLTLSERSLAVDAGAKLQELELAIRNALENEAERQQKQRLQQEARNLLAQADRLVKAKKYKEALDTYVGIANKYPPEHLPAGVDLSALIEKTQQLSTQSVLPPPPPPPADPNRVQAGRLWSEARRLEGQKKWKQALEKCDQIKALPENYYPAGFDTKIKYLKDKIKEEDKLKFFFGGDDASAAPTGPPGDAAT